MIDIQEYKKNVERKTITIKELAKVLDISYVKALRMTHIEGCPVMQFGRDKRIILSKLDDFLEEHIGQII